MASDNYSPGLEGIIAGESAVCSLSGGLRYRGYAIEELADSATFEEVAYLLLYGELPTSDQLAGLKTRLAADQAAFPDQVAEAIESLPLEGSMMDVLRTSASLLSHWDKESRKREPNLRRQAERLVAQLPMAMARGYRRRLDAEFVAPKPDASLAENVLWMVHGAAASAEAVRCMDVSLILYAEHDFNASTFTSRVVVSTLSDLYSGAVAAIGALKGPLHGGANERVLEVLQEVGTHANAEPWVRQALVEKRRIMGFGHRVYKTGDPRARYLKPLCQEMAAEPAQQEMESVAETIETIVQQEKGLVPNLDWPSARLYHYLHLAVDLYTPLFVLSRIAGWSAHMIEQLENNRLIRPLARYIGVEDRDYVPIDERGG